MNAVKDHWLLSILLSELCQTGMQRREQNNFQRVRESSRKSGKLPERGDMSGDLEINGNYPGGKKKWENWALQTEEILFIKEQRQDSWAL